jgi:nitrogen fixation protein FixH
MGAPLTGRKVLLITLAFFGTIIAVNVFMAFKAVGTFPGLEARNSFAVSQTFERDRAAQQALGWTLETTYRDGLLMLDLRDSNGAPAPVAELSATVGRATIASDDIRPAFVRVGDVYEAKAPLTKGKWMVRLEALAEDGTRYQQRIDLFVTG